MKTKLIACVSVLSLMSAMMVFASTNNKINQKNATAKVAKHHKHKHYSPKKHRVHKYSSKVANNRQSPIKAFQAIPALHVWGYGGTHTIGQGQGLVPLMYSQSKTLYLLAEGKEIANTAAHYFGFGGGYRQVVNNRIFGGYLIADENFTDNLANKDFLVLNPGFESLGNKWDFRVNGYFPVGSKSWSVGTSEENISFAGHDEFADLYDNLASIGNGADAEVGAKIPKFDALKAYIGGYYFDEKDTGGITGASGRLEYKINNYLTLEARDTYDNYNNNMALVGFKVSLGGVENKGENGISDRLLDPVEHNLATAATANSVPIRTKSKLIATNQQVNENPIEFVEDDTVDNSLQQDGAVEDGTYEHPYSALNDDVIADIQTQQGTNAVDIYVESGTYSLYNSSLENNELDLPDQYSIYGRTDNFTQAATGSNRPELDGCIYVLGDSTIDSVKIMNDNGNEWVGMDIQNSSNQNNVVLNNVVVGTNDVDNPDKMFEYGIYVSGTNLTISNSEIYAYDPNGFEATGIIVDDSTINLGANNIIGATMDGYSEESSDSSGAEGIAIAYGGIVNINGNGNTIYGLNNSIGVNDCAEGILIYEEGTLNILSDNNTIYGEQTNLGDSEEGIAAGVLFDNNGYRYYESEGDINIIGNGNTIYGLNTGGYDEAAGIYFYGNGEVNIFSSNNNIYGEVAQNAANSDAYGIELNSNSYSSNSLNISGNNNIISANNYVGGSAIGIYGNECSTISITSDGNVISAYSQNNNPEKVSSSESSLDVYGIESYGNLSIMGSNTINVSNDNSNDNGNAYGVYYGGQGYLILENTKINVTNNESSGYFVSEGVYLDYNSNVDNYIIQNNNFNVQYDDATDNAIGIYSVNNLTDEEIAALKNDNIFTGDITDNNKVVFGV